MAGKVLVVEDDDDCLRFMVVMLEGWGYLVDTATSGRHALQRIDEDCPDVVISDLMMPGMSGLELLQAIRAKENCDVFFFLLTGYGTVSTAVKAIEEGADECLLKPIDPDKLHALLLQRGCLGTANAT